MKIIYCIFIVVTLLSCSKTNEHNFMERENDRLNAFILKDVKLFDSLKKDTLIIGFKSFNFCGFENTIKDIDCAPMFKDIKTKALSYGFKTILLDNYNPFNPGLKVSDYSSYLPHYHLHASLNNDNTAYVLESYFYFKGQKITNIIKDTTIQL